MADAIRERRRADAAYAVLATVGLMALGPWFPFIPGSASAVLLIDSHPFVYAGIEAVGAFLAFRARTHRPLPFLGVQALAHAAVGVSFAIEDGIPLSWIVAGSIAGLTAVAAIWAVRVGGQFAWGAVVVAVGCLALAVLPEITGIFLPSPLEFVLFLPVLSFPLTSVGLALVWVLRWRSRVRSPEDLADTFR